MAPVAPAAVSPQWLQLLIRACVFLDMTGVALVVPNLIFRWKEVGISPAGLGMVSSIYSGSQLVGGLILGITETLTGYYISTGYKDVPGLVLLLLVLSLKPSGLFGRATIKKV